MSASEQARQIWADAIARREPDAVNIFGVHTCRGCDGTGIVDQPNWGGDPAEGIVEVPCPVCRRRQHDDYQAALLIHGASRARNHGGDAA